MIGHYLSRQWRSGHWSCASCGHSGAVAILSTQEIQMSYFEITALHGEVAPECKGELHFEVGVQTPPDRRLFAMPLIEMPLWIRFEKKEVR